LQAGGGKPNRDDRESLGNVSFYDEYLEDHNPLKENTSVKSDFAEETLIGDSLLSKLSAKHRRVRDVCI
jgi:hypothetical protein